MVRRYFTVSAISASLKSPLAQAATVLPEIWAWWRWVVVAVCAVTAMLMVSGAGHLCCNAVAILSKASHKCWALSAGGLDVV